MNNHIIIAISGYARSGKDTLAKHLALEWGKHEQADFIVFKFADTLRQSLKHAFVTAGLDYVDPWTEDAEMKKNIRPLLVEFGAYCRTVNRDVWVNATLANIERSIEDAYTPLIPIISDLRYLNEIQRVESWAKNLKKPRVVWHLHIEREDVVAANEEERRSVSELLVGHSPTFCETFKPGDVDGIAYWAKRLVRPWGVTPEWLQDGNHEYAEPNKGTAKWTGTFHGPNGKPITLPHGVSIQPMPLVSGNHEPRIHCMDAPDLDALRFGHTHDPRPAPVEQQLKALWDESLCLDESLDRVSQRVDELQRLGSRDYLTLSELVLKFEKMEKRVDSIGTNLAGHEQDIGRMLEVLERIDARLKRLEVARG